MVSLTYKKGTHMNVVHDVFMPLATVNEDKKSGTQYASEAEKEHIYSDTSSWYVTDNTTKEWTANCRFTDKTKSITYVYNLLTSGTPEAVTWTACVGNQLKLEISVDNYHWEDIVNSGTTVLGNEVRTYDLTKKFTTLNTESSNTLYIRISDSHTDDDNGGCICYNDFCRLSLIYPQRNSVTGDYVTLDWTVSGEDEATYLHWTNAKLSDDSTYYFCDGINKLVMRFPLASIDLSSEVLLTMTNAAQLQVEVSLNNKNWVTAFKHLDIGANAKLAANAQSGGQLSKKERTFDLTEAIKAARKDVSADATIMALYVRIGDSMPNAYDTSGNVTTTGAGWGGQLHGKVTLKARSAEGMGYPYGETKTVVTGPLTEVTDTDGNVTGYKFSGDVNTVLPWGDYKYGQFNTNATWDASQVDASGTEPVLNGGSAGWYGDNQQYYTLRYELPAGTAHWAFAAYFKQSVGIYYCYTSDEATPQPMKYENETVTVLDFDKYTSVYNCKNDDKVSRLSGTLVTIGAETTEEVYANGGYLQLLFVDYTWWNVKVAKTETTDSDNGYGPMILIGKNYPITLTTYISTEDELCNTVSMGKDSYTITESFTVDKVKLNADCTTYTVDTTGDKNYLWKANGGNVSNNLPESALSDKDALTFEGDGQWYGRASDTGYFIYRYKLPVGATDFSWTARIGGEYGIYVAFADENGPTETDWYTDPKNTDGMWKYAGSEAETCDHSATTKKVVIDKSIEPEDLKKGYVYIKINDEIPSDGWGGRVCYGSDYPVTMTWKGLVSSQEVDRIFSVESASLQLTENFNLQIKLNLPATAKGDVKVKMTWDDGTEAKVEKQADGSYLCVDILPQQMTQTLTLTYTGTCMDATTYTSKPFEYSIQDYCRRMIMKNQKNKELVTLLSDILAYGAAAQQYCGDNYLATDIGPVGDNKIDATKALTFTEFVCPTAVSSDKILNGSQPDGFAYKWYGVTLVLDNTMKIRYCFTMNEGAEKSTITVGTQTIAAEEIKQHSDGYYYFDYAVTAANFGTCYTAKFSGADSYTVTYSVNYYVANNYAKFNSSTSDTHNEKIAKLLETVYNYGVSAKAYVAANTASN